MSVTDRLMDCARTHPDDPFIVRACITATTEQFAAKLRADLAAVETLLVLAKSADSNRVREYETQRTSIRDEGERNLASMRRNASALHGICTLHVDNEYRRIHGATRWWRKRRLSAVEDQFKAGLFRALDLEAHHLVTQILEGVGTPTPHPRYGDQ